MIGHNGGMKLEDKNSEVKHLLEDMKLLFLPFLHILGSSQMLRQVDQFWKRMNTLTGKLHLQQKQWQPMLQLKFVNNEKLIQHKLLFLSQNMQHKQAEHLLIYKKEILQPYQISYMDQCYHHEIILLKLLLKILEYTFTSNPNISNKKLILFNDNNTIHVNNPAQYFVAEMNSIAQKLGLSNTYFTNPHGLANRLNRSTAYDVSKLCYYAMKLPLFAQFVRTKEYSCTVTNLGQTRILKWENTNKLLEQGFSGIKTGVTNDACPCLATHFISRKHSYILVVLNCNSKEQRWIDSCRLIDWVTDI